MEISDLVVRIEVLGKQLEHPLSRVLLNFTIPMMDC